MTHLGRKLSPEHRARIASSLRGKKYKTKRPTMMSSTPIASVAPTTKDLCWAAGFLDGEGHFRKTPSSVVVAVTQKGTELLDRLSSLFGGSVNTHDPKAGTWVWQVYGIRARGVMMTLYCLLGNYKRRQIRGAMGWDGIV